MKSPLEPNNVEDHNRMVVAVLLSLVVLMSYQIFFAEPPPPPAAVTAAGNVAMEKAKDDVLRPRGKVIAETPRVPIAGGKVAGSVPLRGLRLDDLLLTEHFKTVEREEQTVLFSPSGAPHAFYAEGGWLATEDSALALPSKDTQWTPAAGSPRTLEGGGPPLRLVWDNGQGLVFTREVALDDGYLFTLTQGVTNNTGAPVRLNPYYLTARSGLAPDYTGICTQHEGAIARFDGKLDDPEYMGGCFWNETLADGDSVEKKGVEGWLGLSDKYWMAVLLPEPGRTFNARIAGEPGDVPHFQADLVGSAVTVEPGATVTDFIHLYAGAKSYNEMEAAEEAYGFDRLTDAIDFGVLGFVTKPVYALFRLLVSTAGNVGLAIILITIIIRAAMFPLANKSYVSMAKMKKVQPQLKAIQEKYKDDRAAMQEHIMALYQKEDANPFSGCWPMIVQIPIFFGLYKVILIAVELRHAPFWGWVDDMSAPDPASVLTLFGLVPWDVPQLLDIGAWPVLFCLTMVMQKRLTPPMTDPIQEKMQSYFPYFITIMMAHFAVGLVIYWTISNVLAIIQQVHITNKMDGEAEKVSILRGHSARRKPKKKKSGA